MNAKEKDELRERFLQNSREREEMAERETEFPQIRWYQGQARAWKYAAKEIENLTFEHPQPLDAGEFFDEKMSDWMKLDYWQQGKNGFKAIMTEFSQSFAQASITAKEKAWKEEKAEDIEAATERIANTISSFMEHCKENGLDISDSYFESYLNA